MSITPSEENDFLESARTLSPKYEAVCPEISAKIPYNLGRIQGTMDHSQEISHLLTPKILPTVQEIKEQVPESPMKLKSISSHLFKRRISRKSPGVIRVTNKITKTSSFIKMDISKKRLNTSHAAIRSQSNKRACRLEQTAKCLVSYTGEFNNGLKNGKGKAEFSNGDWAEGTWKKGQQEGLFNIYNQKFLTMYHGKFEKGKLSGKGTLTFKNGDVLKCSVKNQAIEKGASITYSNQNQYSGDVSNGKLTGQGEMKYSSGFFYRGAWTDNKREGNGVIYSESFFFEGRFLHDYTDGPGVIVQKDLFSVSTSKSHIKSVFDRKIMRDNKTVEFGKLKHLVYFPVLFLDENDYVAISITAKQFKNRVQTGLVFKDGIFKAGKLHGLGYARYGTFGTYTGNFKEGMRCGWGRMVYKNTENECKWMNEIEGVYEGEWKDDYRHGSGMMTWPSGSVYEGMFRGDQRHNVNGKLTLNSGEVYEGGFVNNTFHGMGKIKFNDGVLFLGCFEFGKVKAEGRLEYNNRVYTGLVKDFKPHIFGKLVYNNGDVYEGSFNNGFFFGLGTLHYANGSVYRGMWVNNHKHGNGVMKYTNGEKYQGEWANGKKEGTGVFYSSDGTEVYKGKWKNDREAGLGTQIQFIDYDN